MASPPPMPPMPHSPFLALPCIATALLAVILPPDQAAAQATTGNFATPVKPTVSGKFTGNGKNAAIKFVVVEEHEPFSGKEAMTLIFTEKNPAQAKKPSFDAMFGKLGSALVLNVHHDGGIFGCQVAHSAHQKQGFTSIGTIKMVEFKVVGGNVSGRVSTGKELDTFGEKWEVDLTFAAPLPAKLRGAAPSPGGNPPSAAPRPADSQTAPLAKNEATRPTGPLIAARKLSLPKAGPYE